MIRPRVPTALLLAALLAPLLVATPLAAQGNGPDPAQVKREMSRLFTDGFSSELIARAGAAAPELLLANDRFRVSMTWTSADASGIGEGFEVTADTGAFYFFDQDNIEVILKVLNGCGFNQRFWVFAGGLTDVAVDITVTDTQTSTTKTYTNTLGNAFQPIQDTDAFATCP